MTETPDQPEPAGISDEDLPEDLQPSDDNPLAKPLPEDEEADLDIQGDLENKPNTSDDDSDSGNSEA